MKSTRYLTFSIAFILLCAWMLKSFIPGIVWGAVFAISLWPLFERVSHGLGPRVSNPALLFSVLFLIVFLLPLAYVIYDLTDLYRAGTHMLSRNQDGLIPAPEFLAQLPYADKLTQLWADNISHSDGLFETFNQLSDNQLGHWLSSAAQQLTAGLITMLSMLVSLYFMLKNGGLIKTHYRATLAHWFSDKSLGVVERGVAALRGTINGVILIGLLEGVLLAIPLVLGGVKSGLLLGLSAGLLGVIPLVMPVLIVPGILYLYLSGKIIYTIVLTVDLVLVWTVFENVIKPSLISNAVKVNPYLILIGLLGGLQVMGPVGLFIGPAIVSMSVGMVKDLLSARESV